MAKQTKAKADLEISKLEEKLMTMERGICEACTKSDIDFTRVAELMDDYDLTERRTKQLKQVIEQLFPVAAIAEISSSCEIWLFRRLQKISGN